MISKQALEEFKQIWREEKGTEISDKEAMDEAVNLLSLYNVIYRPIKKEWMEDYEARQLLKQSKRDEKSNSTN